MTVELETDSRPDSALRGLLAEPRDDRPDRTRPNVSGDLPTIFETAPMFRRVLAGYDRFQVDTYVQWAEEQLVTAERERDHLEARHLRRCAELDQARQLLAHSAGAGEFLDVSRRVGSLLAAAADEAEGMRAEAAADRAAAATEAERTLGLAQQLLAGAGAEAARLVAEAAGEALATTTRAGSVLEDAERIRDAARADAEARLADARGVELRAAEHAERIRRQAADDVAAARACGRAEVVGMLAVGREERRRADAEAEATRSRLDRELVVLRAQVEALERRRAALDAELLRPAGAGPVTDRSGTPASRLARAARSLRVR
jgi:colicin import membrane protein